MAKFTFENYKNQKIERLTLIAPAIKEKSKSNRHAYGIFKCDCGNEKTLRIGHVFTHGRDQTKSCGCLRIENNYNIIKKLLPGNEGAKRQIMQHYRHSRPGLEFTLTNEEMENLFQSNCFYCGIQPSRVSTYNYHNKKNKLAENSYYVFNGIDRVDNNLGYTAENCVSCCTDCNFAKRMQTLDHFKNWLKRAYEHTFQVA